MRQKLLFNLGLLRNFKQKIKLEKLRKMLFVLIPVLFLCAFSISSFAQQSVIQITTIGNADPIVPNGDATNFELKITNVQSIPVPAGWKLKVVAAPKWQINSASVGTALTLDSRVDDTYYFILPTIAQENTITVRLNVSPECEIVAGEDRFYYTVYDDAGVAKSDLDKPTEEIANIFDPVLIPDLQASTIVRLNVDTERVMKITQSQNNSYAKQIKVEHTVDTTTLRVIGVKLSIDNINWIDLPATNLIRENGKYTYNINNAVLAALGLGDRLGYNQAIFFKETICYISCSGDGVSNYKITYGKNDVFCSTARTGVAQVSTSAAAFNPNIIQIGPRYKEPAVSASGYTPGVMYVRALNNSTDKFAIMKDVLIPTYHTAGTRDGVSGYAFYKHTRAYLVNNTGAVVPGPGGATDTIFVPIQNNRAGIAGIADNAHTYFVAFDAMDDATNVKIAYARQNPANNIDLDDLDGDGIYNDLPAKNIDTDPGKGISVAIEFINDYSLLTNCMSQLRSGTISFAQIAWRNTCNEYQRFVQAYTTSTTAESTQIWRTRWYFAALKDSKIIPANVSIGDLAVLRIHEGLNSGSSNGGEFAKNNEYYEHFIEITLPVGFEWDSSDPNFKVMIGHSTSEPTYTVNAADIISYNPTTRVLRFQRRAAGPTFYAEDQHYSVTVRVLATAETASLPNNASIKHTLRIGGATGTEYSYSCSSYATAYKVKEACPNFVLDEFEMRRNTFGFKAYNDHTPLTPAEAEAKNKYIAFPNDNVIVEGIAHVTGAFTQSATNKLIATFSYERNSTTRYFDKMEANVKVKRNGSVVIDNYSINDDKITYAYNSTDKIHSISVDCGSISAPFNVDDSVFLELKVRTRSDIPYNLIGNIPKIKLQWVLVNNGNVPDCNMLTQTDFVLRDNRKRGIANTSNGATYNIGQGFGVNMFFLTNSVLGTSGSQYSIPNVEYRPNFQVISDTVVYKINGLVKIKKLQNRFSSTIEMQEGVDYTVGYTPTQTILTILNPQAVNNGYSTMAMTYTDAYYIDFDHIYYPGNLSVQEIARILDVPTSEAPIIRTTTYTGGLSRVVFNYNYNLSSSQPLSEPLSNRAEWPITVSNLSAWGSSYSNDTLHHSWVAIEDKSGSLYDFKLKHNASGTEYTPVAYQSLDNAHTFYWFKIGNLKASAENFTVSARYSSCSSQVDFTVKYSCSKGDFPFDPVRGFQQYGGSSYKNPEKSVTLSLLPPQGAVSGTVAITTAPVNASKPGVYDMCDPICYKATLRSAMSSYLYNPIVVVRKGEGMTWDGTAPTATYGGVPIVGNVTVQETNDSISFILPSSVEIEGFSSGKALEVDFCLLLGDGFVANTATYAYLTAETGCGERFSFLANSTNVKVDGMPENMPIYSMINFEASELRYSANGEGLMTLTGIYNILANGTDGASSFIILPDNLRLVSGTLTSGNYSSNYTAGRDPRIITAPFGDTPQLTANGVEYTVSLNLRATSPGSWTCKTDSITTSSGVTATIICSRGTFKISQMSDIAQVQEFEVSKLDLAFEAMNTTIYGEYYSATEEKVSITAQLNNNSATASGAIKMELYLDNDGDGTLSFGDGPVLGNPFIGISNIGGYDTYEVSKEFIISADDICKLMLVVRQDVNPYICNTISYVPLPKDYELPQSTYTICQGSEVTIGTEPMDSYTYEWTPNSHLSSIDIANPIFKYETVLVNPQTLSYYLTITRKGGCVITKPVDVIVNPLPHLNVPLKLDTICTGGVAYSEISTATSGDVSFSWLRPSVLGINGGAAATGNGDMLLDALNNTTNDLKQVEYIYTTTVNGCSGKDTIKINVFGQASVGNVSTPAGICDGNKLVLTTPVVRNGGAKIISQGWELDGISFDPNTTLSSSDNGKSLRYVISNRCGEFRSNEVLVTVNPIPSLSSSPSESICSGETFNYTIASSVTGTIFSWARLANTSINNNNTKSGSGAIINETLTSSANVPVNVTYRITMSANGCSKTEDITVTVNPKPTLNNTAGLPTSMCSGATYNYPTPAANVTGTTITWERLDVAAIEEPGKMGTGSISEVLTNNSTSPVVVTYEFTLQANGCENIQQVKVTVNPSPILTSEQYPASICSGKVFNYIARSSTRNVTFSWTRDVVAGINGGAAGSGNNERINETLTNSTTAPISVQYKIKMALAGGCESEETVEVIVNPVPVLNSGLTAGSQCSGNYFAYDITSATDGTNHTWRRLSNTNISEPVANGGSALISEKLSIKEGIQAPVTVEYLIFTEANGCKNSGETLSVVINPLPSLEVTPPSVSLAAGANTTVTATTNGEVVSWTSTNTGVVTVAPDGVLNKTAVFNAVASGTAYVTLIVKDPVTNCTNSTNILVNVGSKNTAAMSLALGYPSQICNGGETDLSIDISGGEAPFSVTYSCSINGGAETQVTKNGLQASSRISVTPENTTDAIATAVYKLISVTDNGGQDISTLSNTVSIVISPTPKVTNDFATISPITGCEGSTLSIPPFTSNVSGATFEWTNTNPAINLSMSGTGNIPMFQASNGQGSELTATVTVKALIKSGSNTCSGAEKTFDIKINPQPSFTVIQPNAICAGTGYTFSSATDVTNVNPATGTTVRFYTDASCNNLVGGAVNPGQTTTYYVRAESDKSCKSTISPITLTVNELPTLNSALAASVCSGERFEYTANSATANVSYSWTREAVAGISNVAGSGNGALIRETLINTSTSAIDVTYKIKMSANGCDRTTDVLVTVNPRPELSNIATVANSICSGEDFQYTPSFNLAGSTYNWTRSFVNGIEESETMGINMPIDETLTNGSYLPVTVRYSITMESVANCSNTQEIKTIVQPQPELTSSLYPPAICSGTSFNYTARTRTSGVTYSWKRHANADIEEAALPDFTDGASISEVLTSKSDLPIVVEYEIKMSITGTTCSNREIVEVTVNPSPKVSSDLTDATICSGLPFTYQIESPTPGVSYIWKREKVEGISQTQGFGTIPYINEVLTNTKTTAVTVKYEITVEANGCRALASEKKVIVNPTPVISITNSSPLQLNSGGTETLTANTSETNVTWNSSNASVVEITNQSLLAANIEAKSQGTAVITATVENASNCTSQASIVVNVGAAPTAVLSLAAGTSSEVCNGGSVMMDVTITGGVPPYSINYKDSDGNEGTVTAYSSPYRLVVNVPANNTDVQKILTYKLEKVTYGTSNPPTTISNTGIVAVTINPTAKVQGVSGTVEYCQGEIVPAKTFSSNITDVNRVMYEWTNTNPNIGLAMSGQTTIPSFQADNRVGSQTTAIITVTPTYMGYQQCVGESSSYTIAVNPQPVFSINQPSAICEGGSYTFGAANIVGLQPIDSDVSFYTDQGCTQVITNGGPVSPNQTTTYYVRAESQKGCESEIKEIVLPVNLKPVLNSESFVEICSGTRLEYTSTSALSGVSYSWTRAAVTGISNVAGSGNGASIKETLTNTTNASIDVTYVITMIANGCNNTANVTVTVHPKPELTSVKESAAICSGSPYNYTPTFNMAGVDYSWTRSYMNGIEEPDVSGTGPIDETLTNSSYSTISVRYTINMVSDKNCGSIQEIKVPVFASPLLTSTLYPSPICSGGTFNYAARSRTSGVSYSWNRLANSDINSNDGGASGAGANISETLVNTATYPVTVEYEITMEVTDGTTTCDNIERVEVVVNPSPVLSSSLAQETICSGEPFSYTITSATSGANYIWKRDKVTGISQTQGFGTIPYINEVLTNTTDGSIIVRYDISIEANGCTTSGLTKEVKVNPTPKVSITNASPISLNVGGIETLNANTTESTLTWTSSNPSVVSIGTISGNDVEIEANSQGTAVITVVVENANGCTNSASIIVNVGAAPTAVLSLGSGAASEVCNEGTVMLDVTITGGTSPYTITYTDNVGADQTATAYTSPYRIVTTAPANTGDIPVQVTYQLKTVTYNSGINITSSGAAVVTVNPTAKITSTLDDVLSCQGDIVPGIDFQSNIASANNVMYEWTNTNPNIGLSMSGQTSIPSFQADNKVGNQTSGTITVTPIYLGYEQCRGESKNFTITVNPQPVFTVLRPAAICEKDDYTFSASDITGLQPAGSSVSFYTDAQCATTPISLAVSPSVTTTYYVRAESGATCLSEIKEIVLDVKPLPELNSEKFVSVCSNERFEYTATSALSGVSYSWTRAAVAGISNLAGSGNGASIKETLINTSNAPVNVTYVITMTAGGCPNTENVVVTVNPRPMLTSAVDAGTICSGGQMNYTPTFNIVGGVDYNWVRSNINGIDEVDGSNINTPIDETLTNSSYLPVTVRYSIYMESEYNCINTAEVKGVVLPKPSLTSNQYPNDICSGTNFSYNARSRTPNVSFSWSRIADPSINGGVGNSGTGAVINETLTNSTANPVAVLYEISMTVTENGKICSNPEMIEVVVNPAPTVSSSLVQENICSGEYYTYAIESATPGANFVWKRAKVVGISQQQGFGTLPYINEILTNTTDAPIIVTYDITVDANGCRTSGITKEVIVNPTPEVTINDISPLMLNVSGTHKLEAVSATADPGLTSWTSSNENVIKITSTNGLEANIEAVGQGTAVVIVTVENASGCTGQASIVINVGAAPTAVLSLAAGSSSEVCNGGSSMIEVTITGGTAPYEIEYTDDGGTTTYTATAYTSPFKITVTPPANTGNAAVNVTYELTGVTYSNGTNSITPSGNAVITVNPVVELDKPLNVLVCQDKVVDMVTFTSNVDPSKVIYEWTNDNPNIGLDMSGQSLVPAFQANNKVGTVTIANISVTPRYIGIQNCPGTPKSYTITVNPKPTFMVVQPPAICEDDDYTFSDADVTGVLPVNSTVKFYSDYTCQTEITTAVSPKVSTTYYVRLYSPETCESDVKEITLVVNPLPELTITKSIDVCSGELFEYSATTALTGVAYTWTRAAVAGISNPGRAGVNGSVIRETLINETSSKIDVTYSITMTANGCPKTEEVIVSVYPKPELNNIPSEAERTICSGSSFIYTDPASDVIGTTIEWERFPINGIAEGGKKGNGSINETLTNTTTNPVVVTYEVTLQAGNCINTETIQVLVNPEPELSSSLYMNPICSGGTASYTARSQSKNVSFTWTRAAITEINSNLAGNGNSGIINEILTNSGTEPITVTYEITMTVGLCSASERVEIVVNPIPALTTNGKKTEILCSGDNYIHELETATPNATFTWIRKTNINVLESAATGTGSMISEQLTLRSGVAAPVDVEYTIITEANGCRNGGETIIATVHPLPTVSIITGTPVNLAVNQTTNVESVTNGTVLSWTSSNISVVKVEQDLADATKAKLTAMGEGIAQITIEVEGGNNCRNTATFTVNVEAAHTANMSLAGNALSQICNGDNTTLQMEITGGKAPFTVVYEENGVGKTESITSSNGRFQVTPPANTGNDILSVTYELISVEDADGQPVTVIPSIVTIEVNPTAKITNEASLVGETCEGSIISTAKFETNITNKNRVSYVWFNDNPGIGLAVSGTGHIPTFRAENGTGAPITATITAVATYNGLTNCQDLTEEISFTITINPKPDYVVIHPEAICAGTSINLETKSSEILNDVTPSNVTIEYFSSRSCDASTKVSTVTPEQTTTYYVRLTSDDLCVSEVSEVVVTVNPVPVVDVVNDQILCNNSGINLQLTGSLQGAIYEWARTDSETDISGLASSGTNVVYSHRLSNATTDPKTATIEVTPKYTANGIICTGTKMDFDITVNPTPVLSVALTAGGICSGTSPDYELESATSGIVFTWERMDNDQIAQSPQLKVSDKIEETLTNLSQKTINVRYAVTMELGVCSNTQYVTVPVYPIPELTSALQAGQICSGEDFTYQGTTAVSGAVIEWRRLFNPSIDEPEDSNFALMPINETLTNNTSDPVFVVYEVKMTANGCDRTQEVTVMVGPSLSLTSTDDLGILCSGDVLTYKATSLSTNIQYSWIRKFNANIEPSQSYGSGANINEVLYNHSDIRQPIEYTITMRTSNGCQAEYTITGEICAVPEITVSETEVIIAAGAERILTVTDAHPGNATVSSSNTDIVEVVFDPNALTLTVNAKKAGYAQIIYETACVNACTNKMIIPVVVTNGPMGSLSIAGQSTVCSEGETELQLTSIENGKGPWEVEINYDGGDASSATTFTIGSHMDLPKVFTVTLPENESSSYATYYYRVTKITDSEGSERVSHMGKPAVTVIPVPKVNVIAPQEVCNGSKNDIVYFSGVATNYRWSVDKTVGIDMMGEGLKLPSYELSHNQDVAVTATITVTPEYTINGLTCLGTAGSFEIEINPQPMVNAISNHVACHESDIDITITGNNVSEYIYTSAPLVGLPTGGRITSGDMLSFTADNATSEIVSEDITITPVYAGQTKECYGTPVTFKVTVNPKPTVIPVEDMAFCTGTKVDSYEFTGGTPEATYTWRRIGGDPIVGLSESGTKRLPSFTAYNTSRDILIAEYEVHATITNLGNTCGDVRDTFTITIYPEPIVDYISEEQVYCSGSQTTEIVLGTDVNTIYEWRQTAGYNIGLTPNSGTDTIPSFTTVNKTSMVQIAVIEVTPRIKGTACIGTPLYFNIEVKPEATLTSPTENGEICSGDQFDYEATSTSDRVYYKWERPSISGINNGDRKEGQGYRIRETLINSTDAPIEVLYILNLEYDGCESKDTISVIVNPLPEVSFNFMNYVCWNAAEVSIPYSTSQVSPHEYKLSFTAEGHKVGFNDMLSYEPLPSNLTVALPSSVQPGRYTVTISVRTYTCTKDYSFVIWVNEPIRILEHPESITGICEGGFEIEMSVMATGDSLSYQWFFNGTPIPGATSSTYTAEYNSSMEGTYYAEVSNMCETVQSESAEIKANDVVVEMKYDSTILYVDNKHGHYVEYRWYKDGLAIPNGATSQYYSHEDGLSGWYHVRCYFIDGTYVESCPQYIHNVITKEVTLYPNPADPNVKVTVKLDNAKKTEKAIVILYDVNGKQLLESEMDSNSVEFAAPSTPGLYNVKILRSGETIIKRLIVE